MWLSILNVRLNIKHPDWGIPKKKGPRTSDSWGGRILLGILKSLMTSSLSPPVPKTFSGIRGSVEILLNLKMK
jgi:hypothetical protein